MRAPLPRFKGRSVLELAVSEAGGWAVRDFLAAVEKTQFVPDDTSDVMMAGAAQIGALLDTEAVNEQPGARRKSQKGALGLARGRETHRSMLAPQIHARVAQIKAKEQRDKAEILAMKDISPFASSYLRKIEAREEVSLLESLGLKADETLRLRLAVQRRAAGKGVGTHTATSEIRAS
jgi:hypothetical protein